MLNSYSLKAFLQEALYAAIIGNELKSQYTFKNPLTHASTIPVYRLKSSFPIVYRCAIAKQISVNASLNASLNAEEFTRRIVEKLRENEIFFVEIARSPWIDFRFSDRALASLFDDLIKLHSLPLPNLATSRFNLYQYAHARCLSLLYSASREGFIALHPAQKSLSWQWCEPPSIPWLDPWQWRLQHPTETVLIVELIDLCDRAISNNTRRNREGSWDKQALNLSQKILDCDRACQIWGQPLDIAKARLGLIAVAQRILCWILTEKLMVIPCLEC